MSLPVRTKFCISCQKPKFKEEGTNMLGGRGGWKCFKCLSFAKQKAALVPN